MGKQTDTTVYYCDKCHKHVIGTFGVEKEAECVSVAHGILPNQDQTISSLPFGVTQMNKFIIPSIETSINQINNSTNCYMEIKPIVTYLCADCAEKIIQDYLDKCNEINLLFE